MPNHIHLLLSVKREIGRGDPSPTVDPGSEAVPSSVEAAMGWLKYQITKEINILRNTVGEKVFQRSYFDHIVRNKKDYDEIIKYINENPLRRYYDELYSE